MKHIAAFALTILLVPIVVSAETVVRVGEAIVVDESQVVDGDYYVSVGPFGNTTMSGTINGDMYALGGVVTANGSVGEDLTIVSGGSQLHASVTDDVRLLTGEATVAEHIGGDLFVIGGTLKILSTASIDGNVYFFGGSAVIDGEVGGSVFGTMERLRIDGPIAGNVDVHTYEALTLGSKANVTGTVSFQSIFPLVRAPEAVVEGEVFEREIAQPSDQEVARGMLVPLFVVLFATLSFYLLFRRELGTLFAIIDDSYARSALIGLGTLVLGPIISVLLMVTVLGLLVGVISLTLSIALITLGYALSGAMFGMLLSKQFARQSEPTLVWITVGSLALYGIGFIPIVGPVFILAFLLMTIGGATAGLYRTLS